MNNSKLRILTNKELDKIDNIALEELLKTAEHPTVLRAIVETYFYRQSYEWRVKMISMTKSEIVSKLGFDPYE